MGLDMKLIGVSKEDEFKKEELVTWRKANVIHNWFSTYIIQKYELDTEYIEANEEYVIDKEDLAELLQSCIKVMNHMELAESILPTQSRDVEGFYTTIEEYNQYYVNDILYTIGCISTLLKILKFSDDMEIKYIAEW